MKSHSQYYRFVFWVVLAWFFFLFLKIVLPACESMRRRLIRLLFHTLRKEQRKTNTSLRRLKNFQHHILYKLNLLVIP